MEDWRKNFRKDIVMVDVDALVPKDHLLRKIEDVMDYAAVAVQKSSNRHRFSQSRPQPWHSKHLLGHQRRCPSPMILR